ncbi:MAG TPA: protein translocase subunit SecD, partial [Candidatus Berkiella sp.]|nr:protein translocase subunit SecD [Candidatus Berkiella sp.]
MLNKYPAWKYWLLLAILTVGLIYSAPNLFGEDPAVQVLPSTGRIITKATQEQIEKALAEAEIPFNSIKQENESLLIRFKDTAQQIKAKDIIYDQLGDNYIVALNLAPKTPAWLEALGAKPMKLGLDLRGGVHFLMEVDVDSAITRRMEGFIGDIRTDLRDEKIRYRQIAPSGKEAINLYFDDREMLNKALTHLQKRFGDFDFLPQTQDGKMQITCQLKPGELQNIRSYTLEQTLSTLRNRVNELGVAEAVVQRQGANHIVVELPGIQDTARAKDILGKTATLEFRLHAKEESAKAVPGRQAPPGTKWYYDRNGAPQLLKKRVILTGDSITGASVGADDRTGRPAVLVRVGGAGLPLFKKTTIENVGNLLAVVYIETKTEQENVDGQIVKKNKTLE